MNLEAIWQKIREYTILFYHFAMTEGENKFMLVDADLLHGNNVPDEVMYFFIGSFAVMMLLAIFACDSFQLFHPIEGMREWKSKISIVKVIFFTAAVFSFHTFYKMLITISGGVLGAQASIDALKCLGTYINPISVMVYAYAISTMTFRKRNIQALFLGWALFLTPAAMSYSTLTREHVMLYIVAASFGVVGAVLYRRCSPYTCYFVLSVLYFVCKFFMIYYSEEMAIISSDHWPGKIGQYFACAQMDIILSFLLLMILLGYKEITTDQENLRIKKDIVYVGIMAVFMLCTVVSNQVVEVHAVRLDKERPVYDIPVSSMEDGSGEDNGDILDSEPVVSYVITADVANIRSGPGTGYDVVSTARRGETFSGTGKEEEAANGRLWYEIYIGSGSEATAWASSAVIEKQVTFPAGQLAGLWQGAQGSELILEEDGSCYYRYKSLREGGGTWEVDNQAVMHIYSEAFSYEIYARLNNGYNTTTMTIESDSASWLDEVFSKQ